MKYKITEFEVRNIGPCDKTQYVEGDEGKERTGGLFMRFVLNENIHRSGVAFYKTDSDAEITKKLLNFANMIRYTNTQEGIDEMIKMQGEEK